MIREKYMIVLLNLILISARHQSVNKSWMIKVLADEFNLRNNPPVPYHTHDFFVSRSGRGRCVLWEHREYNYFSIVLLSHFLQHIRYRRVFIAHGQVNSVIIAELLLQQTFYFFTVVQKW